MNKNEIKEQIEEFRESGLFWFINTILHAFGWMIVYDNKEGILYPSRTKYRGFPEESNDRGYKRLATYMVNNAESIKKDAFEEG